MGCGSGSSACGGGRWFARLDGEGFVDRQGWERMRCFVDC